MEEQFQMLDYEVIERASEKYSNIREVLVKAEVDGEVKQYIVEVYKHFSPVSVKNMVMEFVDKIQMVRRFEKNSWTSIMMPYLIFLSIKHFTTLKLPEKFEEQVLAIEKMLNTGLLFQIFVSFEEDEMKKVKEELERIISNIEGKSDLLDELRFSLKEKLVDKSLAD